ncbi:MAG: hypothetical protein FJ278_02935, partial [Planctomycetes bacterium]|nr:hypothetical protein [Planctomycetota bacterium]
MVITFYAIVVVVLAFFLLRRERLIPAVLIGFDGALLGTSFQGGGFLTWLQQWVGYLAAINALGVFCWVLAHRMAQARAVLDAETAALNERVQGVRAECDGLEGDCLEMGRELEDRKNLYELTRRLAPVMEMDALLVEIEAGVRLFFSFGSAWFLTVLGEDRDVGYDLRNSENFTTADELVEPKLLSKMTAAREIIYMPQGLFSDDDSQLPHGTDSFMAIPLEFKGAPAAFILIYNFKAAESSGPKSHEEYFEILTSMKNQ